MNIELEIKGEKFHLVDDETYQNYTTKLEHSEKMRDLSAEYIQRLEKQLERTLSRAIQAENKLSREKMNKEACLSLLLDIDDWFIGMLGAFMVWGNKEKSFGNYIGALLEEDEDGVVPYTVEVIGNIHENPELLEVQE